MVNADDRPVPLPYASGDPAALRPGEHLLWEGGSLANDRRWPWSDDRRPPFRVTNFRAFCTRPGPTSSSSRRPLRRSPVALPVNRAAVFVPRRGPATIRLSDRLWITGVADWQIVARLVAAVRRPPRLIRRRRSPRHPMPPVTPEPQPFTVNPSTVAPSDDLGLLPDERVVWTGRPALPSPLNRAAVVRTLLTLAWLPIPILLLLWTTAVNPSDFRPVRVIGVLIAVVWLLVAGHRLTVGPLRRRWQLRRSHYALTTRRAFAITPDRGGRRVAFVFLDAVAPSFARRHWPDGFGDVAVSGTVDFLRVADPGAVHAALVAAVLAARRDLPDLGWSVGDVARGDDA